MRVSAIPAVPTIELSGHQRPSGAVGVIPTMAVDYVTQIHVDMRLIA